MNLISSESKEIKAPPAAVWAVISDIGNAAAVISAIKDIEVLEPGNDGGIVGLKWKETREWMGRDAVEVMWVTDADEPSFYETRAESHGSIYKSRLELAPTPTGTRLAMTFYCQPQTVGARLMWLLTGWMARKSLCKAIAQDLEDIKVAVENS
ncbi:MAG: SRPBCC family protein [Xanthomonadales bacterium]|nr:SRPBCC family protein [Gammaproteobacteria bacterium]NNK51432.1 SRPBCC family protein [Xanthomonadales bacterium]